MTPNAMGQVASQNSSSAPGQRRVVLFDANKFEAKPKLIIYRALPKPDAISSMPVLIPEFKQLNKDPDSESAKVRAERVLMEEAKRRRAPKATAPDKVDDGEQPGEAAKSEFDDDDIEY
jgi:hypothetical protein